MTSVQVVGTILVFIAHVFWLSNLSENKFSKRKTVLIYIGLLILSTTICILLGTMMALDFDGAVSFMFIITCALFFASYLYLSKDIFLKKLFLFITYVNFFCIVQNAAYLIAGLLLDDNNPVYNIVAISTRCILQFGGLFFYLYFLKNRIKGLATNEQKQWLPICIAGVLFAFLHMSWTVLLTNAWKYTSTDTVIFLVLFVVTIGLYIMIFYTIHCMNIVSEVNMVKQQRKYLQEQIESYEASEAVNSRLRHDMRHHLLSIAAFVQEGDQQAAMDYIHEYDHKILNVAPMRCSKNRAVNSVLCAYDAKFREKQIPLEIHCQVSEDISVEDIDLISLLGNLLENALNGSELCQGEQKTKIYLNEQNEKLIVVCENTCIPTLELEGDLPKHKGIGVSSMLAVCSKYDGHLGYSLNGGICSVCAVLKEK